MKVHLHDEQFDGRPHAWCGRGSNAVPSEMFEATNPPDRCRFCDREWFPNGQPDWHYRASVVRSQREASVEPSGRLDRLLAGAYQVVPFAQLDLPYKLAIAHYMAVDGEAWSEALPEGLFRPSPMKLREVLIDCMPQFNALFGRVCFGVAAIPSNRIRAAILADKEIAGDYANWDAYQAMYAEAPLPEHPNSDRWPVILSSTDDETLQDGWHRVHCYLKRGDETIPAVFYPRSHHLGQMQSKPSRQGVGRTQSTTERQTTPSS